MAKRPENLVVRILRDIQQTLATHTKRFDELECRLDEVNDGMITSLGLAGHGHVRHDRIQKELDSLKKRVKRPEARR